MPFLVLIIFVIIILIILVANIKSYRRRTLTLWSDWARTKGELERRAAL